MPGPPDRLRSADGNRSATRSLWQSALSTSARHVRRAVTSATADIGPTRGDKPRLLATWEQPLRMLALAQVLLAVGLLLTHR